MKPPRSTASGSASSQARVSGPIVALRPLHRAACVGVEQLDLATAQPPRRRDCRGTPVAPTSLQPRDDGIGIRAIADDVAEVPDRIDAAGRRDHGVERAQVGVDVRQDEDPHAR